MSELGKYWPSLLRVTVALYWLYFASQKWNGIDWMHGLIKATADANPIPGLHEVLEAVVVPNWFVFGLLQGAGETDQFGTTPRRVRGGDHGCRARLRRRARASSAAPPPSPGRG